MRQHLKLHIVHRVCLSPGFRDLLDWVLEAGMMPTILKKFHVDNAALAFA